MREPLGDHDTRIFCPSAVSNSIGLSGRGMAGRPFGATGVVPRNGTVCCAAPETAKIVASARMIDPADLLNM